jgi:hypothetical protein
MEQKPNHVCRVCKKAYWACESCDEKNSWKAVACSLDCYDKYLDEIKASRSKSIVETFVYDEVTTKEEFDVEIEPVDEDTIIAETQEEY